MEVRHALFLFDEMRSRLEMENLDNARLAARFLQVAFERAAFFDVMQRYEGRYSRGLLVNSLMHELTRRLETLNSLVETLPAALKKARKPTKSPERLEGLQEIQDIAEDLQANKQDLGALVDAYLQMARENWEAVDVHEVVEKVRLQMAKMAERRQIMIHVEAGEVPPAQAIASRRQEQILLNLVLNAIQQIGHQQETMARLPKRKGDDLVLVQKGQVVIQTRFVATDATCPIHILVIDTGPGVRYPDRNASFAWIRRAERKVTAGAFFSAATWLSSCMAGCGWPAVCALSEAPLPGTAIVPIRRSIMKEICALLIDDTRGEREALARYLRSVAGFQVKPCAAGEEALEHLETASRPTRPSCWTMSLLPTKCPAARSCRRSRRATLICRSSSLPGWTRRGGCRLCPREPTAICASRWTTPNW